MKKIIIVLAILSLVCGTCYAIDKDQAITNALAAQNKAHTVATDSSVAIKIWSTAGLPYIGVGVSSSTSIIIYKNYAYGTQAGYTIDTSSTAYDTVGEVVDYINTNFASDSTVRILAEVGADARRGSGTTMLVPANIIALANQQDGALSIVNRQTNGRIAAGVEGKVGKVNRLKSFTCTHPAGYSATGADGVTYTIYDGNTAVWTQYVTGDSYRTSTNASASTNTVKFPDEKGISVTKGNSILVDAVSDTVGASLSAAEKLVDRISIVYDQLTE